MQLLSPFLRSCLLKNTFLLNPTTLVLSGIRYPSSSSSSFFLFFFYHYIYIIFVIANKLVQAGTWEEKNLNNWATHRIKVNLYSILLLNSLLSLLFVTINNLHFRSSYIAGAAPVGGLLGVLWWQSRNSTSVQMFWWCKFFLSRKDGKFRLDKHLVQ